MKWIHGCVDDFSASTAEDIYCSLSKSRKGRIDRFKKHDDRMRSLMGEYLVKKILASKYGIEIPIIECAENGRPFLKDIPLFISISHSDKMVACAVDDSPIGIDVEKLKPITTNLIDRVCLRPEKEYVFNGSKHCTDKITDIEIITRFYEIWTGKEAYFKAKGTGITDFKEINVLTLERRVINAGDYLLQIVTTP